MLRSSAPHGYCCDGSRPMYLVLRLVSTCSQLTAMLVHKFWVLGVFYHHNKVWNTLVTVCLVHFFLAQKASMSWSAVVGTKKGLFLRRSRWL